MTYTKLIERLREGQTHDFATGNLLDQSVVMDEAADAIEALIAERDALKSKLGDAIRSLANWQHQCTELQAENERLELALEKACRKSEELQSQLDAMGKGEAIYQFKRGDGSWFDQTKASYDYNVKCGVSGLRIVYAAPKALTPLTDEQIYNVFAATVEDAEPFAELVGDPIWAEVVEITRAIESAHGIQAKGGQHEDA